MSALDLLCVLGLALLLAVLAGAAIVIVGWLLRYIAIGAAIGAGFYAVRWVMESIA